MCLQDRPKKILSYRNMLRIRIIYGIKFRPLKSLHVRTKVSWTSCGRLEQISRKYSHLLKNSGLNGSMMKKLFVKPKKNMKSWSNYSIPLLKDMIYIIIFFQISDSTKRKF